MVRASAPKSAKLIANDEVMVVYASAGARRGRRQLPRRRHAAPVRAVTTGVSGG